MGIYATVMERSANLLNWSDPCATGIFAGLLSSAFLNPRGTHASCDVPATLRTLAAQTFVTPSLRVQGPSFLGPHCVEAVSSTTGSSKHTQAHVPTGMCLTHVLLGHRVCIVWRMVSAPGHFPNRRSLL